MKEINSEKTEMNFVSCCELTIILFSEWGAHCVALVGMESMQNRLHHAQLIMYFKSCLDSENASPVIFISSPGDRSFHKKKLISFSSFYWQTQRTLKKMRLACLLPALVIFNLLCLHYRTGSLKNKPQNVDVLKLHNCKRSPDISVSIYSTLS